MAGMGVRLPERRSGGSLKRRCIVLSVCDDEVLCVVTEDIIASRRDDDVDGREVDARGGRGECGGAVFAVGECSGDVPAGREFGRTGINVVGVWGGEVKQQAKKQEERGKSGHDDVVAVRARSVVCSTCRI